MVALLAQFIRTGAALAFWLSLNPFVSPQRSDYASAAPGLIWAKLKSEFTIKKFRPKRTLNDHRSRKEFSDQNDYMELIVEQIKRNVTSQKSIRSDKNS